MSGYVTLSPSCGGATFFALCANKVVVSSERSSMKRFVSPSQSIFSRKIVVALSIFALLGLIGGGSYVAQMHRSAGLTDCLSHTTAFCNTTSHSTGTQRSDSATTTQAITTDSRQAFHFPRSRPKVVPKVKVAVHAAAASSALKVVPTPVPTTTTTTQPTPVSTPPPPLPTNQSSVAKMIEQVFGPYSSAALQVAQCESGLNPNAYNPTSIGSSHAEGVFQILYPSTWDSTSEAASSPYNAMANIKAAYQIFARDGYNWHEWSCAS